MRVLAVLLALVVGGWPCSVLGAAPGDRLARFREMGLRLGAAADGAASLAAALFELVDAEILENLASGAPFSSPEFLEERLDALGSAWGGMSLRLVRPAAGAGALGAVLELEGAPPLGSLRFYGTGAGGPRVLATVTRAGRPEIHPWPAARRGTARLAASWVGEGAPNTGHALWLEVWELQGDREAVPVWQSAAVFPRGLVATGSSVKPGEIAIRFPLDYAGFKVGCEATEHEEVYRAHPPAARIALASRRIINPWHRELTEAADRLFRALESGDRTALARLVPDPRLRAGLPARLRPDGACEERREDGRAAVVAATESGGRALRPWSLRFIKARTGWRLDAATPVLQ